LGIRPSIGNSPFIFPRNPAPVFLQYTGDGNSTQLKIKPSPSPLLLNFTMKTILKSNLVLAATMAFVTVAVAQYIETDLTGYTKSQNTRYTDPNLNGWGMVRLPDGSFAIADTCPGVITFYDSSGKPLPTVITVPPAPSQPFGPIGTPAGLVYNSTSHFVISANGKSAPATLIIATLDGTISGWNPDVDPTNAIIMVDNSIETPIPASYTGLALAQGSHGRNILYAGDGGYAPDFSNNRVDMYDRHFHRVGTFTDPNVASQYPGNTVFQVENVDGQIFVTFAGFSAPFGGVVDIFDTNGNLLTPNHFAANAGGAGPLVNPWPVRRAPSNFGPFSNAILIGNVEDGRINAFSDSGQFLGPLLYTNNTPVFIDGLWDFIFVQGKKNAQLYFTAGPDADDFCGNGLFGFISPKGK
jgi:uncharacterized protein (TIGR03118 family)